MAPSCYLCCTSATCTHLIYLAYCYPNIIYIMFVSKKWSVIEIGLDCTFLISPVQSDLCYLNGLVWFYNFF